MDDMDSMDPMDGMDAVGGPLRYTWGGFNWRRDMRALCVVWAAGIVFAASCFGADVVEKGADMLVGGKPWLRTMITPPDTTSEASREATYKVYTHVYDFAGKDYLTKGAGGKFTHHRGLFIGWKDTLIGGVDYDTWHMTNCTQEHLEWLAQDNGAAASSQKEVIDWKDDDGKPIIHEVRTIAASQGEGGSRLIDFTSELNSKRGTIQLKGDLQHAGMQIRMANEVSEHEDSTQYILPEGAKENKDDEVVGAWWVMGSVIVNENRVWVLHMTSPDLVTGQPVYSIRRYARFGAFFEPELKEGTPLELSFRVVVSEKELDAKACASLYAAYAASRKK